MRPAVYRFMELANHQAAVNSSRGAAFGFASIAKLAGEQLGPHIVRIIPRLYRYQYDPNGKVRRPAAAEVVGGRSRAAASLAGRPIPPGCPAAGAGRHVAHLARAVGRPQGLGDAEL